MFLLSKLVRSASPHAFVAVAMAVYLGQVFVLLLVIIAFKNADWVDGVALGLVALVVTMAWQVFAMIALRRARTLVYDEPSETPEETPVNSVFSPQPCVAATRAGSGSVRPVPPGARRGCLCIPRGEAVSLSVVPAHWLQVGIAAAEGDGGFEAPGTEDFYWPVIGGDSNWAITRPMVVMAISVVLLAWFFVTVAGRLTVVPSKRQWMAEQAYGFVRNSIARDVIGAKDFRPFIPLLMTLFTLILFNNVMGVLPFVQFPTMSRIAFPIVLTLIVYVVYHTVAIRRKHGVIGYLKSLVPPGLPLWLRPIMFFLEVLTYFIIRPLTLALRLFGNMLAGHLMLLVFILGGEYLLIHGSSIFIQLSGILGLAFGVVMTFFELLVQFLQAFIFTLLTALYISDAVSEHH